MPRRWRSYMTLQNAYTILRRPRYALRRLRKLYYEHRHPRDPWIAPEAVEALTAFLRPDSTVVEWGSGRSTAWFARRARCVVSVEHDRQWFLAVQAELKSAGLEARVRHHLARTRENPSVYVGSVDGIPLRSVDLVLVDGIWREECVRAAIPLLRPGGLLVVDNSDRQASWPVPPSWPLVLAADFFGERTSMWQVPLTIDA
jgi:predicted O-methyltransferase YrrM